MSSDSKIHCDLDRNQDYKKNRAPESTADKDSSVYDILDSVNISTMEILNRANNGSKHELSLDFDIGLDHSQFVPETPGSPSPIIGAPDRPNGGINLNQECDIKDEYFEIESQEIENVSTLD